MSTTAKATGPNPLGYEKIGKLLVKFAIPSIISLLVGALYNIVDQLFIGQGVGMLGNAATNVAFPLTTLCTAIALLIGLGGSSSFNIAQGAGQKENATRFAATATTLMIAFGVGLAALVLIFLRPLTTLFGATELVMPYALDYIGITAFGMPFLIFSTAFTPLIRADGSPTYAMVCMVAGAVINTILDPIFIFGFGWGMKGAAVATIIGQIISGLLCFRYLFHFRHVDFEKHHFKPTAPVTKRILALGMAGFFNQVSLAVVQIALNNTLTFYGSQSSYGAEVPLAVAGIISKVNIIFMSIIIGIAQGNQPIVGFNYGARQFDRVKKAWKLAALCGMVVSCVAWIIFQLFPLQIISLFGEGSPEYFAFAERWYRTFMLAFFLIGIHPVTANFFTSIGKPYKGIFIALTRQIIFFLPLIVLLPIFFGIDGVMFSAPIADTVSSVLAIILVAGEFKKMGKNPGDVDSSIQLE